MEQVEKLIERHINEVYANSFTTDALPLWLKTEHWRPRFLLRSKDKKKILAIDIILSGVIPKYQYTKIVSKLLSKYRNFYASVVTLEESYEDNPEIEIFCKTYGIGLKIVIPGIGVQTIIRTEFDRPQEQKQLTLEDGWFPLTILEKAKGLSKLSFHKIIDNFVEKVRVLGSDEQKTLNLVHDTIDKLLSCHSSFTGNFGQFMKLSQFEKLLKLTDPNSSEHVFHSLRVFLAGCPVINEFYDQFRNAQMPFSSSKRKLRVEYAWFLTAIFHDTGRPKEGAMEFISDTLDDEDLEISISGSETRWARAHNITARRVLGSLGAFIVNAKAGEEWDGGIIDDEDSDNFTAEWIKIYDGMKSHAVISAFDFLGDIFEKAMAANERMHRPFIVTHAAPAALSILLHHWKIWPKMRKMKLIPVNASMLPMAALLIYIDTWDNYKRRGKDPLIFIKEYLVDSNGACVKIEWGNLDLMKKDEVGYIEYKKALENLLFSLEIEYGMVGTI
jgi:hypothetical protein